MLHDQNYVLKCLGGLLCYQITWEKYQRLEKATQRPAKARLKSITIVYKDASDLLLRMDLTDKTHNLKV